MAAYQKVDGCDFSKTISIDQRMTTPVQHYEDHVKVKLRNAKAEPAKKMIVLQSHSHNFLFWVVLEPCSHGSY